MPTRAKVLFPAVRRQECRRCRLERSAPLLLLHLATPNVTMTVTVSVTSVEAACHDLTYFSRFAAWQLECVDTASGHSMDRDDENGFPRELYSNFFKVGFNSAEFLLDFGRHFEDDEARLHLRIILGPAHAKELSRLLERSVHSYEAKFGPIVDGPA
jgi:hypothetical protein